MLHSDLFLFFGRGNKSLGGNLCYGKPTAECNPRRRAREANVPTFCIFFSITATFGNVIYIFIILNATSNVIIVHRYLRETVGFERLNFLK